MSILLLSNMVPGNHKCEQALLHSLKIPIKKIGYIPAHTSPDKKYFESVRRHYAKLGADIVDCFDVDEEYDPNIFPQIFNYDLIHLCGGNTAYFLSCLQKNGILPDVKKFIQSGKPVIGVSAGAIILGRDIEIAFDDKVERDNKHLLSDTLGLNLYNFEFYPHYSGHKQDTEYLKKRSHAVGRKIYACDDGAGIIVSDKRLLPVGKVFEFSKGKRIEP